MRTRCAGCTAGSRSSRARRPRSTGARKAALVHAGIAKTYSFHMVLSYSRDPFCCYVDSIDLGDVLRLPPRAFAHFGGVPGALVYDRAKTVVKRHVAPGKAVPLHPEAAAFADHYGYAIDVLAAYRPTGKPRVAYCTSWG